MASSNTLAIMKKVRTCVALVFALVTMISCVTPQTKTTTGQNETKTEYEPDRFVTGFVGDSFTSGEKAYDVCLLQASEICLLYGYTYFTIRNSETSIETSTITTKSFESNITRAMGGKLTQSKIYNPETKLDVELHKVQITFVCFNEKPTNSKIDIIDAEEMISILRSRYVTSE